MLINFQIKYATVLTALIVIFMVMFLTISVSDILHAENEPNDSFTTVKERDDDLNNAKINATIESKWNINEDFGKVASMQQARVTEILRDFKIANYIPNAEVEIENTTIITASIPISDFSIIVSSFYRIVSYSSIGDDCFVNISGTIITCPGSITQLQYTYLGSIPVSGQQIEIPIEGSFGVSGTVNWSAKLSFPSAKLAYVSSNISPGSNSGNILQWRLENTTSIQITTILEEIHKTFLPMIVR